jgi:hypothetical protein
MTLNGEKYQTLERVATSSNTVGVILDQNIPNNETLSRSNLLIFSVLCLYYAVFVEFVN